MKYDILLNTEKQTSVIAKPSGWPWTPAERTDPFEIVSIEVESSSEDKSISFFASCGLVAVQLSWIDPMLVLQRLI